MGANGNASQPVAPVGVVAVVVAVSSAHEVTVSLVVCGPLQLVGKVMREPTFHEPVTIKADFLPDRVISKPIDVPGNQEEFRLVFQAENSVSPGEHQIQLVFSSVIGNQERKVPYKIPPRVMRLLVSPKETISKLTNAGR